MKIHKSIVTLAFLICLATASSAQDATDGPAPKALIDFNSPDAAKQVAAAKSTPNKSVTAESSIPAGSSVTVEKDGIEVNLTSWQTGDADHPGLEVKPASGTTWDLSAYGHVEAKITNTGTAGINIVMHVVPKGEGNWTERNMEAIQIKPGETKTLKVVFGYSKGFKPVAPPAFNSASVAEIYIYLYHSTQPHSFRIDELKAAGKAGEVPESIPAK
jgi:hypothetical protein